MWVNILVGELTGGRIVSLGQVWNQFFLHKNRPFDPQEIFIYKRKQPILFWTNSAQMMQPYLRKAVALQVLVDLVTIKVSELVATN